MSADNMLMIVKVPKREQDGHEWLVADINFSGFEHDLWMREKSDELILALADMMRRSIGRSDSEQIVSGLVIDYLQEQIVEYGSAHYELRFPLPTKEEIAAANARWKADRPRRECSWRIEGLQARIARLEEEIASFPAGTRHLEAEISEYEQSLDDGWLSLAQELREKDLPARQAELDHKQEELMQLRIELETEQIKLSLIPAQATDP